MRSIMVLWLLAAYLSCQAQIDKKFWFAAPDIDRSHADRPVYLRVATLNQKANVKISLPAQNRVLAQFTLNANGIQSVDLTSAIELVENDTYGEVSTKGVLVESDQELSIYYEVRGTSDRFTISNSDIYSLKGSNALGTEFLLPMQTHWKAAAQAPHAYASFQIVATEDQTVLEIIPTQALFNHKGGETFTVNLNRGEVYTDRAASMEPTDRPTGTVIKSNKKVAVTMTDDSMYDETFPVNGWAAWDMGGDQLVPVDRLGTDYLVSKICQDTAALDRIFITGVENMTEILFNGSVAFTLNRSETRAIVLRENLNYIQASKPIYVFHVGGFTSELAAALIPPLGCTGSKRVSLALDNVFGAYMSIMIEKGAEGSFQINGRDGMLVAADFKEVPYKKDYLYARVPVNLISQPGHIVVENTAKSFHLALLNQEESGTFVYGYFSDFGTIDLPDTTYSCPEASIWLHAGFGKDSYAWYKNNLLVADSSSIEASEAGRYRVVASKGQCTFVDSTVLVPHSIDSDLFASDTIRFCYQSKDSIGVSNKYSAYLWNTGEKKPKILPKEDRRYELTVKDVNDCPISDAVVVETYSYDSLKVSAPTPEEYCFRDSCFSLTIHSKYASYTVNQVLGMEPSICWPRSPEDTYRLQVMDDFNCIQNLEIHYSCEGYLGPIPNIITTSNKDGLNDVFRIPHMRPGIWDLEVYSRYGTKVYESKGYRNEWAATDVEPGVYFYELSYKKQNLSFKGWVEVR